MRIILSALSMLLLLASCASSNNTQVFAAMSGMNAGATLGSAIGGLTSRSSRGYYMGTTIGALSGAAIGVIATTPRHKRSDRDSGVSEEVSRRNSSASLPPLSGLRRDVRVTNVSFCDSSGDGTLQPGETATVSYDIINVTPRTIDLLIPQMQLSSQAKRIHISPMQDLTNISSGEGVRYSVTLTASPRLKRGYPELTLYLSYDGGESFTAMNSIQIKTNRQ